MNIIMIYLMVGIVFTLLMNAFGLWYDKESMKIAYQQPMIWIVLVFSVINWPGAIMSAIFCTVTAFLFVRYTKADLV